MEQNQNIRWKLVWCNS